MTPPCLPIHGKWWLLLGLAPAACLGQVGPLFSQAGAPAPDTRQAFQITPYLWVTGLKGDLSPFKRGPSMGIEKSFSDVWHDLNAGGFLNLWARRDRYVLSGDLLYVDTSESEIVQGLPLLGALEGTVDSRLFMASLQGGYRVYQSGQASLDLLAGGSFWHVGTRAHLQSRPFSVSHKENVNWVDPLIGLRVFYRFTDRFSVQAQGSLGGFVAGSRHSHQAVATVNYDWNEKLSVAIGYKVLDVDYRRGGHVFDTRMSGPVLGLSWRF